MKTVVNFAVYAAAQEQIQNMKRLACELGEEEQANIRMDVVDNAEAFREKIESGRTYQAVFAGMQEAEAVRELMREIVKMRAGRTAYFVYSYRNEEYRIAYENILYFESLGRKVHLHLASGETQSYNGRIIEAVRQTEKATDLFLRIHQSFYVNYTYIQAKSNTHIHLVNGEILPVSHERRKRFAQQYEERLR